MNRPPTPLLDASLAEAPIVKRGDYHYFVHPLTDGIPALEPALMAEVGDALAGIMGPRPDRIVTAEAMGIPASLALSARIGVPVTIVRKRAYGLPNEVAIPAQTGYGSSTLYMNSIEPGMNVTIVDDVMSTGGTMRSLIRGLKATGADLQEILIVLSRGTGLDEVRATTDVPIKVLRHIHVDQATGRLHVIDRPKLGA